MVADRYKVLELIGSGSFGEVFEGIDMISNIRVAIKLVSFVLSITDSLQERIGHESPSLLYEARILRLLQSRGVGIPRLYHTG